MWRLGKLTDFPSQLCNAHRTHFFKRNAGAFGRNCNVAGLNRRTGSTNNATLSLPRKLLRWYVSKLDTHPLTTKCFSSGVISGSGDVLCQYLARDRKDNCDQTIEWTRTLRFAILGLCLVGPTVTIWYGFLMSRIPGAGPTAVACRLFCDQGLFAPVFLPTFISCLTLLEYVFPDAASTEENRDGEGISTPHDQGKDFALRLRTRLRDDVPDALVVGWSIWIPAMGIMFTVVPGKFQVLFSNAVGFFWNAYLSWRTHEGEEEGD